MADGQPESEASASKVNSSNGKESTSGFEASAAELVGSSTESSSPVEKKKDGFPHRWRVVAMIATAFVLGNMDKVNMSVAVIPMAQELGWSGLERGLVSSSFFWGYTLTQVPGGYISTKIGGAKVLAAGVFLWSLGTLIAPPAAQLSLMALCLTRMIVGMGEGVAPSAATSVLAKTMPPNERTRAVATVWGGLDVGSVVGLLLCGPLIRAFGWSSVFYLFGFLGLLWCTLWPLFKPEEVQEVEDAHQQYSAMSSIEEPVELDEKFSPPETISVPWGEFFTSLPVWAVTVAHFSFNWGYYTLLAWLPSYFELALGLAVDKSSFLTLIPYLAMTSMMPLVGPTADGMVERGVPLTTVRKICQGVAFVGPAICMVACALLTPTTAASATPMVTTAIVSLLSIAFALGAWSRGGLYCNHQDLSPKYAGASRPLRALLFHV